MQSFDWIVVGNGLAGAALGYELARQGLSVLVLEQSLEPENATRYSYGGIPFWAGTTPLTQQLNREGIAKQRQLPAELDADTEFRLLDLLLTISPDADPQAVAERYAAMDIPPQLISPSAAQEREPQLNPAAISGALVVEHGHVSPRALVAAYNRAMQRRGGVLAIAPVTGLVQVRQRVTGVTTPTQAYAGQVAVAAGAYSRELLQALGLQVPVYFTQAELLETPPVDLKLRTLVMPADNQRFAMEAEVSAPEQEPLWQEPGHLLAPAILDSGAIQFRGGYLRIGQISQPHSSLQPEADPAASEEQMRQGIGELLPKLAGLPGQWHRCQVSFSRDSLPLVGPVEGLEGLQLFAGFSSPFSLLPPIAERFARSVAGEADPLLAQMSPGRFAQVAAE